MFVILLFPQIEYITCDLREAKRNIVIGGIATVCIELGSSADRWLKHCGLILISTRPQLLSVGSKLVSDKLWNRLRLNSLVHRPIGTY